MPAQHEHLPWDRDGWLEESIAWIKAQLAALGYHIIGSVEILHQRPWSTFAQVATDKGIVYFKAPAPAYHYEAGVTKFLSRLRPDCTVLLLVIDLDRGWMLSEDSGNTLRSVSPSIDQIDYWVKILPLYVELQIEMAGKVQELLALGMYDRRLMQLPHLYTELLEQTESLRLGLEAGLSSADYQRLRDLRPQVTAWCEELAGYGLPETLMHEEIHDSNVLVNGDRFIFTDWSDSSVSHPFFSMLVTLRAAAHRLELEEDGAVMMRVRDAFLEPWTKFATRADLMSALKLAYHLAMLTRVLAWYHGTGSLSKQHKEPYADYVPGWLQDFLNYEH